ncbi:MAG: heavy metal-binding domain-containing protein, partial [bacterium]
MNNKKNMVFKSFIIFLFCIFLLVNFNACYENKSVEKREVKTEKSHKVVYTCPMHPQVKQDKPGSCPICKMDLVPIDDSKKDEGSKKDLEKDSHKHTPEKTHEHFHEHSRLNYDKVNQDQIKTSSNFLSIRTSFAIPTFKAKYMEVSNTYEAVAYTELSEAFLYNIYFNTPVWIESTFGTFEGQLVKKGQKILKIRSLEIEETKKELEIARKYKDKKMEEFILKKLSILRQYSFGKLSSDGIVVSNSDFILV